MVVDQGLIPSIIGQGLWQYVDPIHMYYPTSLTIVLHKHKHEEQTAKYGQHYPQVNLHLCKHVYVFQYAICL